MMIKLNSLNFFKNIFIFLFCVNFFHTYFLTSKVANSQTNVSKNNSISNIKSKEIQVSELEEPSLGSLGINTEINKIIGLNIWQNMTAKDIIEHLNYIPDVTSSKHLQIFLNDLYLSTSVPPKGNSDDILKFLETRLLKMKNSGNSKNLYKLVSQLPLGDRWEGWRKW